MKKISYVLVVAIILSLLLPVMVSAAPVSGNITQSISEKIEIIPGANLSHYYFGSWTYHAFPIWSKINTAAGEIFDNPASISDWTTQSAGADINGYSNIGCRVSYSNSYTAPTASQYLNITYQQMYSAYISVMRNGFPLSNRYLEYGLTPAQAYYATNFAIQRLSQMFRDNTDYGANYGDNGTYIGQLTAMYAWYLEQGAKELLLRNTSYPALDVACLPEMQIGTGIYEGYFVNNISIKVPSGQDVNLYSQNTGIQWTDFAGVKVGINGNLSKMITNSDGTKSITGTVYIPMSDCKGDEIIKFNVGGQAANLMYGIDVYDCQSYDGNQPFLVADPASIGETQTPVNLAITQHQFKVPKVTNLTIDSITTNQDKYEAETDGTVTAVVRNSGYTPVSNAEVRLTVNPSSTFSIANKDANISYLAPGATTNVSWNIKSGALSYDTWGKFTAKVDPDNKISETNENDNDKSIDALVYRLKPDLIVESVLTNKEPGRTFEAEEVIVITATVRNIGKATAAASVLQLSQIAPDSMQLEGFDQSQQPLPNPMFYTPIGELAPGASVSVSWRFINPIRVEARNVDATATADIYNVVAELKEDNNTNSIRLTLNPGMPDFTPVWQNVIENQVFKAGYEAIISAKIRNIGKISSDRVNIRLSISGTNYYDVIDIPTATPNYPTGFHSAGGNLASFRALMPNVPGVYTMTITADHASIIMEEREDNNIATIRIVVEEEITPSVIEVTDPDIEDKFTGVVPDPPDIPYTDTTFWEEIRKTGDKKYEVKTYFAKLKQEFVLYPAAYVSRTEIPNEIESGYGLEGSTLTVIETNYDRPNLIVGSQIVRTYYPETNYGNMPYLGYHEKLQLVSGGNDFWRKWIMKVNPTSVKGFAVHYTPKWFPDGTYNALSHAFCSYTPAGQLTSVAINGDVKITGDMYDRVTSGNR